jgi:hypothetical protein
LVDFSALWLKRAGASMCRFFMPFMPLLRRFNEKFVDVSFVFADSLALQIKLGFLMNFPFFID